MYNKNSMYIYQCNNSLCIENTSCLGIFQSSDLEASRIYHRFVAVGQQFLYQRLGLGMRPGCWEHVGYVGTGLIFFRCTENRGDWDISKKTTLVHMVYMVKKNLYGYGPSKNSWDYYGICWIFSHRLQQKIQPVNPRVLLVNPGGSGSRDGSHGFPI